MQEETLLQEVQQDFQNAKKRKRKKKEKVEEVKKPDVWKRVKLMFVGIVMLFIGVAYCAERYVYWRAGHQWQFPLVWIGMVREIVTHNINPATGEVARKPMTDIEVIEQYRLAPYLKSMYQLESSKGKNDGCKDQGKFNGYGFMQNGNDWVCYESFEEVTELVNAWLEDHLTEFGNDLSTTLCHYNLGSVNGIIPNNCDYSYNFMTVLTGNL